MKVLQLTAGIVLSMFMLVGPVAAQSPSFDAHTSMMIVDDPQEVVNVIALPPKSELIELRKGRKGASNAETADEARNEAANEARRESEDARETQRESPPPPEQGNSGLLELILEQVGPVLE